MGWVLIVTKAGITKERVLPCYLQVLMVMKKSDWPRLHVTESASNHSYTFSKEISPFQTFSMGSFPGGH